MPDVLVIGGGIIGAACASEFARRGADVTLVERDELAAHASGRNQGLWILPEDAATIPMARLSLGRYLEVASEAPIDVALDLEPIGQIFLARDEGRTRDGPEGRRTRRGRGRPRGSARQRGARRGGTRRHGRGRRCVARAQRTPPGPGSPHGCPRPGRPRARGGGAPPPPRARLGPSRRSRGRRGDGRRRHRGEHHHRRRRSLVVQTARPRRGAVAGHRRQGLAGPTGPTARSGQPSRARRASGGSSPRDRARSARSCARCCRTDCRRARSRRCWFPIETARSWSAPPVRFGSPPNPTRRTWCAGCSPKPSELAPSLRDVEVRSTWWGLRPLSPDERPFVGPVLDGLAVATGHGSEGVILGAGSAILLASQLAGEDPPYDPVPFAPGRFA